jgi:protein-L-isoaspartate O-methyltransferase
MDAANRAATMVETQIAARGLRDPRLLAAMRQVPRDLFVDEKLSDFAYTDTPWRSVKARRSRNPSSSRS